MPDLPVMCGSLSITANPSPGCCSSSAKLHNNPSSCALPYLPTTAAVLSSHPFTSAAYLRSLLLPCSPSSVVYLAFCPFLLFYYFSLATLPVYRLPLPSLLLASTCLSCRHLPFTTSLFLLQLLLRPYYFLPYLFIPSNVNSFFFSDGPWFLFLSHLNRNLVPTRSPASTTPSCLSIHPPAARPLHPAAHSCTA
jgi:hypothetical protein